MALPRAWPVHQNVESTVIREEEVAEAGTTGGGGGASSSPLLPTKNLSLQGGEVKPSKELLGMMQKRKCPLHHPHGACTHHLSVHTLLEGR